MGVAGEKISRGIKSLIKTTFLCNDLKIRWSENDGSAYS
jgi:hypothetical protein